MERRGKGGMSQRVLETEGFVQGEEVCDASSRETMCSLYLYPLPSTSSPHTPARSLTRSLVSGLWSESEQKKSLWLPSSHSTLINRNLHCHPDFSSSQGPLGASQSSLILSHPFLA